jgi:hypothetical protein
MNLDRNAVADADAFRCFILDICSSIGTACSKPVMKRLITRACRLSRAMIMIVASSPGPRNARQSQNAAKKTAIVPRMKDLPARRPHTSHASCAGSAAGVLRPVCF